MSAKTATSDQVITLPKGGGALSGIGEKFVPDLQMGTGHFSVPLDLPAGRNGFQPGLQLAYSTGTPEGVFGFGWSLAVPAVTRKTEKGIPRYRDAEDIFLLSGTEDLVPVSGGSAGTTQYRPRTEGLFARIVHHQRDGDYWKVESKDGLVSFYGTPPPADVESNWRDPAVVADPQDRSHIFSWQLTLTIDPFGNRIEYSYERDSNPVDGQHRWDQLYLRQIRYVDYGSPEEPHFLVGVRFVYEPRPHPFSNSGRGSRSGPYAVAGGSRLEHSPGRFDWRALIT